jgi:tetratricopeptide (TPR) repeat protein
MNSQEIAENYFNKLQRVALLMEVSRYTEALVELKDHLSTYPGDYTALCNMAICHYQLGDFQLSYDLTKQAIESAPDEEWAYRIQSFVFASNGEHKRSLDAAKLCIEQAPDSPDALHCLFSAQANYGELDGAAETLDSLKKVMPDSSGTYESTGFLALKTERYADAEAAYLEALRLDPESVTALNNLGVVYMNMSEKGLGYHYREKALEMFNRAARAEPTFKTAQENISVASTPLKFTAPFGIIFAIWIVMRLLGSAVNSTKPEFDSTIVEASESFLLDVLNVYTTIAIVSAFLLSLLLLSPKFRQKMIYRFTKSKAWFIVSGIFVLPSIYYLTAFWKLGARATPFTGILFGLSLIITLVSGLNGLARLRSS